MTILYTRLKVAICTERVEAKRHRLELLRLHGGCNLHGACGGKAAFVFGWTITHEVAICTERVEAKCLAFLLLGKAQVAICTERVEAKERIYDTRSYRYVAICTERVEAKVCCDGKTRYQFCCNLHGACGGKVNLGAL